MVDRRGEGRGERGCWRAVTGIALWTLQRALCTCTQNESTHCWTLENADRSRSRRPSWPSSTMVGSVSALSFYQRRTFSYVYPRNRINMALKIADCRSRDSSRSSRDSRSCRNLRTSIVISSLGRETETNVACTNPLPRIFQRTVLIFNPGYAGMLHNFRRIIFTSRDKFSDRGAIRGKSYFESIQVSPKSASRSTDLFPSERMRNEQSGRAFSLDDSLGEPLPPPPQNKR